MSINALSTILMIVLHLTIGVKSFFAVFVCAHYQIIQKAQIQRLYFGGSFVSSKEKPSDIDYIIISNNTIDIPLLIDKYNEAIQKECEITSLFHYQLFASHTTFRCRNILNRFQGGGVGIVLVNDSSLSKCIVKLFEKYKSILH